MQNLAIGIDLGGTKVLTGLVDTKTGEVLYSVKKKTKKDKGPEKIIKKIIKSINEILEEKSISISDISSIGIGAAGQVDREKGVLIAAPNLDCFDLPVKSMIEAEFNVPVILGNDVEIATIGEMYFGAGQGHKDFVCVFVGTGVGSGIVQEGKIRHGATGTAGEIGHLIVDVGGRPCACGGNGCLEAYGSRLAVEKRISGALRKGRKSDISNYLVEGKGIKTSMMKKALDNGDELVIQSLEEGAEYLACGLASVINFYNPALIILGGGLVDAIDFFYHKAIKIAKGKSLPTPAEAIEFKKAELGDFSGVIGASLLSEYRATHDR
ncbi:MAG: ROK family protein [Candidatus Gastranaerophilales bacterium]|nr:ROK family protein [Candidatus Gastranaerophilales bacterium]